MECLGYNKKEKIIAIIVEVQWHFFYYYAFQRHVNTLYTREFVFASSFLISLTFSAPIRSFARVDLHFSLSHSFWYVLLSCVWPGSEKKTFQCTYVQNYSCFGVQGYRSLYVPSYLHHCGTVYKNKKLLRSNNNNIKIKNAIHEQMKFN